MPIRAFVNPSHLSFIASGGVFALELEAPFVHTWVIYAIIGVLMALLLWRVATQWKNRSQEAQNLRITVIILVVLGGAMAAWLFGGALIGNRL
jgi:membrane protein implicated in regulation of membrane protease activity